MRLLGLHRCCRIENFENSQYTGIRWGNSNVLGTLWPKVGRGLIWKHAVCLGSCTNSPRCFACVIVIKNAVKKNVKERNYIMN